MWRGVLFSDKPGLFAPHQISILRNRTDKSAPKTRLIHSRDVDPFPGRRQPTLGRTCEERRIVPVKNAVLYNEAFAMSKWILIQLGALCESMRSPAIPILSMIPQKRVQRVPHTLPEGHYQTRACHVSTKLLRSFCWHASNQVLPKKTSTLF